MDQDAGALFQKHLIYAKGRDNHLKNTVWVRFAALLLCLGILLSACGGKAPSTESEPVTEPVMEPIPTDQEEADKAETFLASYIGKTAGEVIESFGNDFIFDYDEGSDFIGYLDAESSILFLFGGTVGELSDDLLIRQLSTNSTKPVVYQLYGAMTYPEIVENVNREIELEEPEHYFNELDGEWEYVLDFTYQEYELYYTWYDDPAVSPSVSVVVTMPGKVESIIPPEPAAEIPSEPSDHTADIDDAEYYDDLYDPSAVFTGPRWFYGTMGSRFYVPEGFVHQPNDYLMRSVGMHHYIFFNESLDMEILVFECTFAVLPVEISDMKAEYEELKAVDGVTYSASGKSYYVVSGYRNDDEIYYYWTDYDETFYRRVEFSYPAEQSEICDKILVEFLEDYSFE